MTRSSPFPRLLLLGHFVAQSASGLGVTLPKKGQALLAYLLLHRGRHIARDEIAALLWSNSGSEQARQSLRQCMSSIRKAHPDLTRIFLSRGDMLALAAPGAIGSDIDEFARLEASGSLPDLAHADSLFRGEFVAGLAVRQPFDDWAENERRRFADARVRILSDLAKQQAHANDYVAAVETARRLTSVDAFREESSRLLMELLAASDQRGLALVEHARLERVLREELQMAPDSATRRLADNIRRGRAELVRSAEAETAATDASVAARDGTPLLTRPRNLPDRPTITVLAFANLTGDPSDDYFLQSLADEVTSALVREKWPVVVLAPRSAAVAPPSGALGVRYVTAGSFRRDGGKIRIILRLTDAPRGQLVWSDRLETEAGSLFAQHDQLCAQIVSRLAAAVSNAEVRRVSRQPVELLTTYEIYLRASELCRRGAEENSAALKLLRRAIEREPDFAPAYALAARCLHLRRLMGWAFPEDPLLQDAIGLAHRAISIDDRDPQVLWMSGLAIANVDGNLRDGLHLVARSLAINPTNASAWIGSSFIHANLGEGKAAIEDFKRAQQVNPDDASQHLQWHAAATAYFIAGHHDEADLAADKALAERPTYPGTLRLKIATSGLLGRTAAAHEAAQRLTTVNSDVTISYVRKYWELWPYTEHAVAAMLEGWRRAGMPEGNH